MIDSTVDFLSTAAGPERLSPLSPAETTAISIHLNSFYVNVRGALDNLAWMVAYESELLGSISENDKKQRTRVGLFNAEFLAALGHRFVQTRAEIVALGPWSAALADLRDPAAHRVPLYVAPAALGPEDMDRHDRLEKEKRLAISERRLDDVLKLDDEQWKLGRFLPVFLKAPSDPRSAELIYPAIARDAGNLARMARAIFSEIAPDSIESRE